MRENTDQKNSEYGHFSRSKKIENKPCNGVNSYYNISDDSQPAEPDLGPNTLDSPTPDKCPNKELEESIINDTENTIHKLNL